MDLALTEPQEMLKKQARDFLQKNSPSSLVRQMEEDDLGYRPQLWAAMAELGWLGLAVPEEYGGSGGSFLDLSVLLEEMGRALLPSPFIPQLLGQLIILEAGSHEQKKDLLPAIGSGKLIVIPAWTLPGTEYDISAKLKAVRAKNNYLLSGSRLFVPYAKAAHYLICPADSGKDDTSLFMVDIRSPGLEYSLLPTIARDKQFEVKFSDVTVPRTNLLGELNKGRIYLDSVLPRALVAKSMEMLGGAQKVVDMSIEYAKKRVQFEHPIGSFQAIQHHAANMAIDLEVARFLAYKTAWMISRGLPCTTQAYMTKAWLNDAYRRIVVLGKQIFGGYGIITEYDLQLYFRREKGDEVFLGDSDFCREKIAGAVLDNKS